MKVEAALRGDARLLFQPLSNLEEDFNLPSVCPGVCVL